METTRVDGVKAPLHNGTPSYYRDRHLVGVVHRGHGATCVVSRFWRRLRRARSAAVLFGASPAWEGSVAASSLLYGLLV